MRRRPPLVLRLTGVVLVGVAMRHRAGDRGLHRLTPGYTFNASGTYPIALTLPVLTGLSLSEYYEFGTGNDDTFGYFQVGPAVSVPLAFIPPAFGTWQLKASLAWLRLGDNLRTINRNDRNEIIGTIGISLAY